MPDGDRDAATGTPLDADLDYRDRRPDNVPPDLDLDGSVTTGVDYSTTFVGSEVNVADDSNATVEDINGDDIAVLTLTIGGETADAATETLTIGNATLALDRNDSQSGVAVTGVTTTFDIAVTNSGTTFTITRNGAGDIPLADLEALLREIIYNNTTINPTVGDRTITMVANDGAADSNPPVISTITINPPTPPTLDLDGDNDVTGNDYQTRYSLGGSPISISDDVLVGDADSVNLQSASIYLRTRPDGDGAESLLIDGALPGGITTTGFDRAAGTIELTGDASIADYQTAIAQIEYNNTIGLQLSDRLIEVIVNDGIFDSNLAVTTIDMVVPPYIDLDGNNSSFT